MSLRPDFPVDTDLFPFERYTLVGHSGKASEANEEAEYEVARAFEHAGLTDFEVDVITYAVGNKFSVREIERLTGVPRSVVSRTIQTAKAKLLAIGAVGDWGPSGSTARLEHEGVPAWVKPVENQQPSTDRSAGCDGSSDIETL